MLIHYTELLAVVARAATRLHEEGQDNQQLVALLRELNPVADEAEKRGDEITKLLEETRKTLG
jgi:ABC-type transporter Mla subunit MlaD